MLAKVYLENNRVIFEALSEVDVKDGIYPSGKHGNSFRIGVVVCNSAVNLAVERSAEEAFKRLFREVTRNRDAIGDIDWYRSDNNELVFSWVGMNRKEFDLNNLGQYEQARTCRFYEGQYILID